MIRKISIVAPLLLALAGCNGSDLSDFYGKVQEQAVKTCNYVPTINTIAGVVATLNGHPEIAASVSAVSSVICTAVTKASEQHALMSGAPRVNGVKIEGWRAGNP